MQDVINKLKSEYLTVLLNIFFCLYFIVINLSYVFSYLFYTLRTCSYNWMLYLLAIMLLYYHTSTLLSPASHFFWCYVHCIFSWLAVFLFRSLELCYIIPSKHSFLSLPGDMANWWCALLLRFDPLHDLHGHSRSFSIFPRGWYLPFACAFLLYLKSHLLLLSSYFKFHLWLFYWLPFVWYLSSES